MLEYLDKGRFYFRNIKNAYYQAFKNLDTMRFIMEKFTQCEDTLHFLQQV